RTYWTATVGLPNVATPPTLITIARLLPITPTGTRTFAWTIPFTRPGAAPMNSTFAGTPLMLAVAPTVSLSSWLVGFTDPVLLGGFVIPPPVIYTAITELGAAGLVVALRGPLKLPS